MAFAEGLSVSICLLNVLIRRNCQSNAVLASSIFFCRRMTFCLTAETCRLAFETVFLDTATACLTSANYVFLAHLTFVANFHASLLTTWPIFATVDFSRRYYASRLFCRATCHYILNISFVFANLFSSFLRRGQTRRPLRKKYSC